MVSGAFSSLVGLLPAAQFKPIYELARPILETVPETGEGREIVTRLSGGIELSHVTFRYTETMPPRARQPLAQDTPRPVRGHSRAHRLREIDAFAPAPRLRDRRRRARCTTTGGQRQRLMIARAVAGKPRVHTLGAKTRIGSRGTRPGRIFLRYGEALYAAGGL